MIQKKKKNSCLLQNFDRNMQFLHLGTDERYHARVINQTDHPLHGAKDTRAQSTG